jgi:hypothetical protein
VMDFYTDQQNQMAKKVIRNTIFAAFDIQDEALVNRIHNDAMTEADKTLLGETYAHIVAAKELRKIKGPYFPLMRHGDWVMRATLKVTPPSNPDVRPIEPNVFDFKNRKEAIAWAEKQDTHTSIEVVHVDPATGELFFTDPDTEQQVKVTAKDVEGEKRFRVTVQNKHVEFFETQAEAEQAAALFENDANYENVNAQAKAFERRDFTVDMSSMQMRSLMLSLEKRAGFSKLTPRQQTELRQTLKEMSVRFLGSNRIQSRRLPRGYVEGASNDLVRNMYTYAKGTAGYLARLDHQPDIDAALKELVQTYGDYDKDTSIGRSTITNEVQRRIEKATAFEDISMFNGWAQRVLTASFTSHLLSPAYSIINGLQPAMLTLPQLSARYGVARASHMMIKAYNDIGAMNVARGGMAATFHAVRRPNDAPSSYISDIKSRLKEQRERDLIDYLVIVGSIDPDAGLEVSRLAEASKGVQGQVDKGLHWLQGVARAMPRSVETINRSVSALAAYRMEYERTGDHDAAVLYAQETTNMTQGLYSHTNAPTIFNHPLGRLTLQFKKYGQLIYGMIGHNIGKAIRNVEPGDRAEALRTLAFIGATHVALAGALGLPTEPIKWLVMGANMAGVTDLTWSDVENAQRRMASNWLGTGLGEIATRGLPRVFGLDLSSRVGLNDVFTFGEPKTEKPEDVWAYLGQLVGGAPGSVIMDTLEGSRDIWAGNFVEGLEKAIPAKIITDGIKAYRVTMEGKKSAAGYQTFEPYNAVEAGLQVVGLRTAREAEASEQRRQFYSQSTRETATRNDWMHRWVDATPNERARLWGQIEKWNKGRAKDQRLSRSELESYKKRRRTENVVSGIRMTKRDKSIYQGTLDTYNLR